MLFIENFSIYMQFFIGLLAVTNPLGSLPIFMSMTSNQYEAERQKTMLVTSTAIGIVLLTSLFIGQALLNFFSISLSSFRVAGGILVISIAMTMIGGKLGEEKQNKEERATDFSDNESIAVVPLAMPLIAGPGAISSTIVWASRYNSWVDWLGFAIAIIIFSFLCYAIFRSGPMIMKYLGKTGSNVVTRIMGLILMALGIEICVAGISNLFPGLLH
ncbi:hypothetical protein QV08_02165 [Gallibacterium salpingitidis]|uniref:UPF0056 membrane protein n=1 Tax=Gallibacterium salpingitidis TaxID=505341 RepID=A0A1A7Q974_9PAST|nr:YchE family NAAT transporter [Gallibacterium salpingitidis]OBW95979.1 hypothetical protein QS62_01790 [Gallibacterium salpingitidis]OBX09269.1 hypothetical protein QV08_02165 [Gallibacterium salpingitidis]OBX10666.1 hypothetical protein QV09_05005 [Gallibacterium salpingitidis]WKT00240.1 YchE family NAAT transporter [Gallibacterium salpingitidis]